MQNSRQGDGKMCHHAIICGPSQKSSQLKTQDDFYFSNSLFNISIVWSTNHFETLFSTAANNFHTFSH